MTIKTKLSQLTTGALMLALSALVVPTAMAHGAAAPVHGGIVQTAADLSFELVATAEGVQIYIQDHGKDADASRFEGKLTVLNGAEKSEAPLKPAGANRLEAKGVSLSKGAKAIAVLTTNSKKSITVRFAVR
ncbi:hypothetical protein [Acidovorax sp. FHTAMBA]|jgi:hypothetical protein|uniref:hypothetical protein n=1 Tax=Acidovorax sp. FHTAMBA TaxID=3140252 RepID=UPI003182BEE0